MSVPVSSPAKNKLSAGVAYSTLEAIRLRPEWENGLLQFLRDLKASGDDMFFSPHPTNAGAIRHIAAHEGKDLYYLLIEQGVVLGYGMLRGWDEGYLIPSLGLAIHPSARGQGLGKMFMEFLHLLAFRKGADKVRLRVRANNEKAINLYKGLGYSFEEDAAQSDFLVGFKEVGRGAV